MFYLFFKSPSTLWRCHCGRWNARRAFPQPLRDRRQRFDDGGAGGDERCSGAAVAVRALGGWRSRPRWGLEGLRDGALFEAMLNVKRWGKDELFYDGWWRNRGIGMNRVHCHWFQVIHSRIRSFLLGRYSWVVYMLYLEFPSDAGWMLEFGVGQTGSNMRWCPPDVCGLLLSN